MHWVIGKRAVQEVLVHCPQRIRTLYATHPFLHAKVLSKKALTSLVQTEEHQGVAAEMLERPERSLADLLAHSSRLVMLDMIFDPQNVGAILRAAECFGVEGVIFSKNRGMASLTTTTISKASAGASELIDHVRVSNLADTLRKCQDAGFCVMAADAHPTAHSLQSFTFPERGVLLLGSEGRGVQPLLLKQSDVRLFIPMRGKLSSLNVAQATAVILSHWHASHPFKPKPS